MPRLAPLATALLLLAPTTLADHVETPDAIIGQTQAIVYEDYPANTKQSNIWIAFPLSPSDPDQIEGSFNYTLHTMGSDGATFDFLLDDAGDTMIPSGKTGWVRVHTCDLGGFPGYCNTIIQTGSIQINVSADDAGHDSGASPTLLMFQTVPGDFLQLGNLTLRPVPGVGEIVETLASDDEFGVVNVTWAMSPDDPDDGTFGYRFHWDETDPDGQSQFNATPRFNGFFPTFPLNGDYRFRPFTVQGTREFGLQMRLQAVDNRTKERANLSCVVSVNVRVVDARSICGQQTPVGFGNGTIVDAPTFPLLNVPDIAEGLNITEDTLGLALGGLLVLGGGVAGVTFAGAIGGGVAATLAFILAIILGLIPAWFAVVAFLAATALIVLSRRG